MAVKSVPQKFEASDGAIFATAKQAAKHDRLASALRDHEKAMNHLLRVLAESQQTADGVQFEAMGDYYVIGGFYWPEMHRVSFYPWTIGDYEIRPDQVVRLYAYSERKEDRHGYMISELYRNRSAAEKALREKRKQRLEELEKSIDGK